MFCFDFRSCDLADKNLQKWADANSRPHPPLDDNDDRIRADFKIMIDGYQKMFDQQLSKSNDLGDMLWSLPASAKVHFT